MLPGFIVGENTLIVRDMEIEDMEQVRNLFSTSFGKRNLDFEELCKELIVASDVDNKVVAFTGLTQISKYTGYEVTWTCVDIEYRNRGLITEMLKHLLTNYGLKTGDKVFCSCWRNKGSTKINLNNAMRENNFNKVISDVKNYRKGYNKLCLNCTQSRGDTCYCAEDLYMYIH